MNHPVIILNHTDLILQGIRLIPQTRQLSICSKWPINENIQKVELGKQIFLKFTKSLSFASGTMGSSISTENVKFSKLLKFSKGIWVDKTCINTLSLSKIIIASFKLNFLYFWFLRNITMIQSERNLSRVSLMDMSVLS